MNELRRWLAMVPVVAVVAVLSACGGMGSSTGGTGSGGQTEVKAANVTIGGHSQNVLTDGSGRTLYYFLLDSGGKMACSGSCTAEWKALMVSGNAPSAGQGVTGTLSTMPAASGGTVATYNGWPLYTYVGDSGPGMASGEGVDDFGGQWFAVRVDLRPNQTGASPTVPAPAPSGSYNSGY